jgi:hypothetical protein
MSGFGKRTDDEFDALFQKIEKLYVGLAAEKTTSVETTASVKTIASAETTASVGTIAASAETIADIFAQDEGEEEEEDEEDEEEEDKVAKHDLLNISHLPADLRRPIAEARRVSNSLKGCCRVGIAAVNAARRLVNYTNAWNIPTGYSLSVILDELKRLGVRHVVEIASGSGFLTALLRFASQNRMLAIEFYPSDPDFEDLGRHAYIDDIHPLDAVDALKENLDHFMNQGIMAIVWSRARGFIGELQEYIAREDFEHLTILLIFYTEGYGMSCEPEEFYDRLVADGFEEVLSLDREDSVEFFEGADKHDYLLIYRKDPKVHKKGARC